MRPIIETPVLNPIHFVPDQSPTDNRSKQYWQEWHYNRLSSGQDRKAFRQPVELNQRVPLQFHVSVSADVRLELYSCHGIMIHTWAPVAVLNIPGNVEQYSGRQLQLYTHYFRFRFSDVADLEEDTYYLSLRAIDVEEVTRIDSEPIHLAAFHPNTFLIEYANNTNDYNAIFEQTNCRFAIRVPGMVGIVSPEFQYTSYKNQKSRVTKLSAQPGSTLKLVLDGVPDYLHVKVNAALCCDNLRFRGGTDDEATGFVVDDGAKWDQNLPDGSGLRGAELTIRESDPDRSTFIVYPGSLDIATVPNSYPYAVQLLAMGETTASLNLISYIPRIIHNSGELDGLVAFLNGVRDTYELEGEFTRAATTFGFKIVYTNGANERYLARDAKILTSPFNVSLTIPAGGGTAGFAFTQGFIVADWGDGTAENGYAFAAAQTMQHLYTAGNKTLTIYGNLGDFGTTGSTSGAFITALGGIFPPTTTGINLVKTKITAFDGNMLDNCLVTLQTLVIRQGILATIDNVYNKQFFRLTSVSFASNKLTAGYVGVVLKMVYEYVNPINLRSGNLILNGQTPAAPPGFGVVQAFKNPLISSFGWNVTTD